MLQAARSLRGLPSLPRAGEPTDGALAGVDDILTGINNRCLGLAVQHLRSTLRHDVTVSGSGTHHLVQDEVRSTGKSCCGSARAFECVVCSHNWIRSERHGRRNGSSTQCPSDNAMMQRMVGSWLAGVEINRGVSCMSRISRDMQTTRIIIMVAYLLWSLQGRGSNRLPSIIHVI